ncbi:FbpB family small basic protein [Virgibacillus ainsalahensis]
MRPKSLNFEQLVQQNKQALLEDEKQLSKIELRLEKRQTDLVNEKQADR